MSSLDDVTKLFKGEPDWDTPINKNFQILEDNISGLTSVVGETTDTLAREKINELEQQLIAGGHIPNPVGNTGIGYIHDFNSDSEIKESSNGELDTLNGVYKASTRNITFPVIVDQAVSNSKQLKLNTGENIVIDDFLNITGSNNQIKRKVNTDIENTNYINLETTVPSFNVGGAIGSGAHYQQSIDRDSLGNFYYTIKADNKVSVFKYNINTRTWSNMNLPIPTQAQTPGSIYVDNDDNVHYFWYGLDDDNPTYNQIKYSMFNGVAWSQWRNIINPNTDHQYAPSIVVDNNNVVHLTYWGYGGSGTYGKIYYANNEGGSWSTTTLVAEVTSKNQFAPIPILDNNGVLSILWYGGDATYSKDQIKMSTYNAGTSTWSTWTNIIPTVDYAHSGINGMYDSSNNLHIVWQGYDATHTAASTHQIKYAMYDGSTWTTPVNVGEVGSNRGQWSGQLMIDDTDTLHVLWYGYDDENTSNRQINYTKKVVGGSWTPRTVIYPNDELLVVALGHNRTIRNFEFPLTFYANTTTHDLTMVGILKETKTTNTNITKTHGDLIDFDTMKDKQIIINEINKRFFTKGEKVVADKAGNLYVTWYTSPSYMIEVYKFDITTKTWSNLNIDQTDLSPYQELYPSIVVDSKDHIHVFWSGEDAGITNRTIKYSKYDGSSWSHWTNIFDNETRTVACPTSVIDKNDNIYVTCYHQHNDGTYDVKFGKFDGTALVDVKIISGVDNNKNDTDPIIKIDSKGNIHVVYMGYLTSSQGQTSINYIMRDAVTGTWSDPVMVSNADGYHKQYTVMSIDNDDDIHVAWYGKSTGYTTTQILYNKKVDGEWSDVENITKDVSNNHSGVSIHVDKEKTVHLIWMGKTSVHTNLVVQYSKKYHGGSWSTPRMVVKDSGGIDYPIYCDTMTNMLDPIFVCTTPSGPAIRGSYIPTKTVQSVEVENTITSLAEGDRVQYTSNPMSKLELDNQNFFSELTIVDKTAINKIKLDVETKSDQKIEVIRDTINSTDISLNTDSVSVGDKLFVDGSVSVVTEKHAESFTTNFTASPELTITDILMNYLSLEIVPQKNMVSGKNKHIYSALAYNSEMDIYDYDPFNKSWSKLPRPTITRAVTAPALLIDNERNKLHCAWTEAVGSYNEPAYAVYDITAGTWSDTQHPSGGGDSPYYPDMSFYGDNGELMIMWGASSGRPHYATVSANGVVSTASSIAGYPQSAPKSITSIGNTLYATWVGKDSTYTTINNVKTAKYENGTWSTPVNIFPSSSRHSSYSSILAIDNKLHIIWIFDNKLHYAVKDSAMNNVISPHAFISDSYNHTSPQITVNDKGRIFIIWISRQSPDNIVYRYSDDKGASWSNKTRMSSDPLQVQQYKVLSNGPFDSPVICYISDSTLKFMGTYSIPSTKYIMDRTVNVTTGTNILYGDVIEPFHKGQPFTLLSVDDNGKYSFEYSDPVNNNVDLKIMFKNIKLDKINYSIGNNI